MASKKHKRTSMWESLTKQGIIEAGIKIITRQGVQGLTIDKVALEAGVAKGDLGTCMCILKTSNRCLNP